MVQAAKKQTTSNKMGELLVQNNIITKHQLLEIQRSKGNEGAEQLITYLLDRGEVAEDDVMQFLAEQYNCQVVKVEDFTISEKVIKMVPQKFCRQHSLIPLSFIGDTLVVACSNPMNVFAKEQLAFMTNYKIEMVLASKRSILEAVDVYFEQTSKEMHKIFSEIESAEIHFRKKYKLDKDDNVSVIKLNKNDPEPIVRCVNRIISGAIKKNSSDIHIESYEKTCRIRYRIDGKLQEFFHPPKEISSFIISRFKVMSQLDIGEKRKPQDGRLKVSLDEGKEINFRVSTAPTVGGEKVVLRVLDESGLLVDVKDLGMTTKEESMFQTALTAPQGLILVCGPTGSGKTTTIYSGLNLLNDKHRNISTAEDPVEYKIEGLNQVQVHPKIGLTFSSALRSFLRQDPDVIFVGEIRDFESAQTAFQAAATGHLVISTIHTNDTPSVVTRLLDIGIPDYSITDTVSLVIGQRLLRRVCKKCAVVDVVSESSLKMLGLSADQMKKAKNSIKKGKGCRTCSHIGYKGRIAIFEMLQIGDSIKSSIFNKVPSAKIKSDAIASGALTTVRQSGIHRMLEGVVSFEEVLYGTKADEL